MTDLESRLKQKIEDWEICRMGTLSPEDKAVAQGRIGAYREVLGWL